jgi:hypothetical protein
MLIKQSYIKYKIQKKEEFIMANKKLVPQTKEGLNKFKMEAAKEVGVSLKYGYIGNLNSREVKKMVESYEKNL